MIPVMPRPNPEGYKGGSDEGEWVAQAEFGHMGINDYTDAGIASDIAWRRNARSEVESELKGAFPDADHASHEPYGPDVDSR